MDYCRLKGQTEVKLADWTRDAEQSSDYWLQRLYTSLTSDILETMANEGITQAELAQRIDAKPSWITRLMKSEANVTLRTIARLALTVGKRPALRLIAPDEEIVVRKKAQRRADEPELSRRAV